MNSTKQLFEKIDAWLEEHPLSTNQATRPLIEEMRQEILWINQRIADLLEPVKYIDWAGKWRLHKILELIKEQ